MWLQGRLQTYVYWSIHNILMWTNMSDTYKMIGEKQIGI